MRNINPNSYFNDNDDFWKTETGIGFTWEKWVANKIGAEHLEFNKNGCDLSLDGHKIDVKAANAWRRKTRNGENLKKKQAKVWVFNRNKVKPCDIFICVCLENNTPVKVLEIPSKVFPLSGITIGTNSKYDVYTSSRILW